MSDTPHATEPELDHQARIAQAQEAVQRAATSVGSDPERPQFHFTAPARWMNDPNGPIFYRGWYHAFYQHHPYGDQWDQMHWGHARSRDLIHWEHLPIALAPMKTLGEDHVFSGSTYLRPDGSPAIFYTSIGEGREPEQWAALPKDDDLIRWERTSRNPVLAVSLHGETQIAEWRDPYLFEEGGRTFLVAGGNIDGHGIVALYESTAADLLSWEYRGVMFHYQGGNVECPNFLKFGDRYALLLSVEGRVDWFSGRFDLETLTFSASQSGTLLDGSYASQAFRDELGQWVHLAWVHMDRHVGWNGALTLPTHLELDESGTLLCRPISAVHDLFTTVFEETDIDLYTPRDLSEEFAGERFRVRLSWGPAELTSLELKLFGQSVSIDSAAIVLPGRKPVPVPSTERVNLDLYFDGCLLSAFSNDGRVHVISHVQPDLNAPKLVIGGTGTLEQITVQSTSEVVTRTADSSEIPR